MTYFNQNHYENGIPQVEQLEDTVKRYALWKVASLRIGQLNAEFADWMFLGNTSDQSPEANRSLLFRTGKLYIT